ncbi:hypothetical protein [Micromonospora antibiotica]|uniref:CopG family transcriptional regulator n=1 Tax=Micromonospora antibiotica TaxID=2807623 RepID=A0ABS3V0Z1_9ACTN|nr:hypothetical protein [Micromonospora antibiotica]MBO4159282.1 hypothetical protein [Micromonospora antibiotica]
MSLNREEALRLANEPVTNWIDQAEVEYEPRPAVNVFPVRLGPVDDMSVAKEADRRGVNPSVVIEDLVGQARRAADSSPSDQDAGDGPGFQG